jgi:hypothetical protein
VNYGESRLLDGAVRELALNGRRLPFPVGEESAGAVSAGANPGLRWANGRWLNNRPAAVPSRQRS